MLVVTGDSNTAALAEGFSRLPRARRDALENTFAGVVVGGIMRGFDTQEPFFEVTADGVRFAHFPQAPLFFDLTGAGTIIADDPRVFGFCIGFHSVPLARTDVWKQFSFRTDTEKRFISKAVLTEIINQHLAYVLQFVDALQAIRVRFFMISAPPLRQVFLNKYPHLSATDHVRFQRIYRAITTRKLASRNIPVLMPPAATSREGVLLPQYELEDPDDDHHANGLYGTLVWEMIGDYLARLPGPPLSTVAAG